MSGTKGRVFLAATLIVVTGLTGFAGAAPAPADIGDPTESAVTVRGTGDFANLEVTVNQTKNLINQTILLKWKGAAPTPAGPIKSNFLQVMQCWGDDPGPDRTQCQLGALPPPPDQFNLATRQLLNPHVFDPLETGELDPTSPDNFIPYWVPGDPKPTKLIGPLVSPYLDAALSNEAPQLRTRQDGTGEEFFEVQTFRQNAGLDCGRAIGTGSSATGKSCWLVIVPRAQTEVDGSHQNQLESSPLSKTNWSNRIQLKLEFLPVEQACQIGAAERPVRGQETVVEAISRWQPVLCANNGPVFSYTQYPDELARQALAGSKPSLEVLTDPLPPDRAPPDRPVVYAPITLSGLAFAFNIEYQPFRDHVNEHAGRRFERMRLTPRLVAKLLTQSYKGSVANQDEKKYLKDNPSELTRDPDFLQLNPEYEFQDSTNRAAEPIVTFGNADAVALLWAWVLGDAEAHDFLNGQPDPWKMIVNPNNKGITEAVPFYPRNDPSCELLQFAEGTARSCTTDLHPVASDMHDGGRSAGRGDIFSRVPTGIVSGSVPPLVSFSRPGRAGPGTRSVLAVVDTATAARFGLETAELKNAAGQFVAPTTESIEHGLAAMKPSAVSGVLKPDPRSTDAKAYPLTTLSYAATEPAALDKAAGEAYARFLSYAAGPGQEPGVHIGQLPDGYVPLPQNLRAQTTAAANTIKANAGVLPPSNTETPGGPAPSGGFVDTGGNTSNTGSGAGTGGVPAAGPAAPAAAQKAAPGPGSAVVTKAEPTPAVPAPAVWTLVVALLVCGALAGSLSPLAHYLSTRRADGGR